MKALERQLNKPKTTKEKDSIADFDTWARWMLEREEAIDNATTIKQKKEVASKYARMYKGSI